MARQKLSEYRAKTLLARSLQQPYAGLTLDAQAGWEAQLAKLPASARYVVKVDEGVKGRFKQGLVKLGLTTAELPAAARGLFAKGYRYLLVEPEVPHEAVDERYLCLARIRDGVRITANPHGGVEVNAAAAHMVAGLYGQTEAARLAAAINLPAATLDRLVRLFDDNYLGFLELNPLVVAPDGAVYLLDAAAEVDGEAVSLVAGRWTAADLRRHRRLTPEAAAVLDLASRSQSSFRLEVLNPNGQVFLLLSGGGASVTLADEVHNQGWGKALANYGEYSGNPTADETFIYTQQILSLLLKSSARPKVLIVAGGVANFTDIRVTFDGVIRALRAAEPQLIKQEIKVYVRRGGPHEAEGLARMAAYLEGAGLLGQVAGPELSLADIIPLALAHLTAGATV
ncbi:MAG TPA: ATP citrate lyase citrate-binding domain-containing protein [Candidatus Saccharimonadia bacterium]